MKLTKQYLLNAILASTTAVASESDETVKEMQRACDANVFYVDAIPLFGGGYAIGSMDDALPNVYATREEALKEIQDMRSSYEQDIVAGERDVDDEYEGVLLRASITGDNELSLYPEYDAEGAEPIWVGELSLAMGV